MLIFATARYQYLLREMCRYGGFESGNVEVRPCPDGERILRIESELAGRDVGLVGGTISEADTLELFDLACGVVQEGATSLTLVVPYFGYSTMERAEKPGEVVTAKTRARLLSAIPLAPTGNRIAMLDLHCADIAYYFGGMLRPIHLSAHWLLMTSIRQLGGRDFVLGCADTGGVKWVQSLAREMDVPVAFVFKRRISEERTEVTAVSAAVEGKPVIIYDDMIRSGVTLLGAAQAYRRAGARSVAVVATHGLLPGDALLRLRESQLFSHIVCTDSHPRATEMQDPILSVESIGPLLADFLKRPG
jgi:ribose-phosphate pyrophosphokinase